LAVDIEGIKLDNVVLESRMEHKTNTRIKVSSQKINLHTLSGKKIVTCGSSQVYKMMGPILPVFHLASAKSKKIQPIPTTCVD
jgi:hypothetical protein